MYSLCLLFLTHSEVGSNNLRLLKSSFGLSRDLFSPNTVIVAFTQKSLHFYSLHFPTLHHINITT